MPRADIVLFVLSADRPLSDSEVRFLQYIRKWDKKVVFLLNKVRARAHACGPCTARTKSSESMVRAPGRGVHALARRWTCWRTQKKCKRW